MRSVVDPARPTLRLVHREGDPRGVVAAAVFTTGGSRGALLLGHLIRSRLARAGKWVPELAVHGIGFVVTAEATSPQDAAALLRALHAALIAPAEPGEVATAGLARALAVAQAPLAGPSLIGACGAEFGAEGAAPFAAERAPTAKELEELRATSVRSLRIGLSALGAPPLLDAVRKAHDGRWPKGEAPSDPWPAEDQIALRPSAGVLELRVAARVVDRGVALRAGRSLQDPEHPVFSRLAALDPSFDPGPVSVALRPNGACVALTVVHSGATTPAPSTLAAATLVLEQELLRSLHDAPLEDASGLGTLSPESASAAASLAAWTAVSAPSKAAPPVTLVEVVAPRSGGLETASLSRLLGEAHTAFERRQLPLVSRSESGQPESWLLVGTPCGTAPEPPHEAGLRTLALESAARAWNGRNGVQIEPWIEARALGLLAHGHRNEGESPEQLGERLARGAALALAFGKIDGTTVASARSRLLLALGSDPGHDFMMRALSGDRPSSLDPRGLEREVAAFGALDVERARAALTREPLRVAYLASAHKAEAAAAQAEISRLLAPHRSDVLPCPRATLAPSAPGAWSITSVDSSVNSSGFVGVPVKTSAPTGFALEFLLNREGGYLDRALEEPGLADGAHAQFLPGSFGGALVLTVHAREADLDRAIAQARGLLESLSKGLPAADARLARQEEASLREAARRNPRGRVVELWLGSLPPPPLEADLRALAAQLGPAAHRVVKVQVRAGAPSD